MFRDTTLPASASAALSGSEATRTFNPSISSIREHIARQRADRMLDQFAEQFTADNYFPEGGDGLLFSILTWLPQWPVNMGIVVVDNKGGSLGSYLKGNDWSVVEQTITFVQRDDGTYSAPGSSQTYLTESLFWVMFSQLPATTEIGDWGEDKTVPCRIVRLRAQVSVWVRLERGWLFDALMADDHVSKSISATSESNRYLPFSTAALQDGSPVLLSLSELNPHLPLDRLEDLLRTQALTEREEAELVNNGGLPQPFFVALQDSRAEWAHDRAIDGLLHTRVFDEQTDVLARTLTEHLLKTRLGRDMRITTYDEGHPSAERDTHHLALVSFGEGIYGRGDEDGVRFSRAGNNTDSFYLAISYQLQDYERNVLGLKSECDVTALRSAVAKLAIDENGGWFPSEGLERPAWFIQASTADKAAWEEAAHGYIQALVEAQAPGLPDVLAYGDPAQLRMYARAALHERLKIDHGLELEPDDVVIETLIPEVAGIVIVDEPVTTEPKDRKELCSLTELSLKNFGFLDALSSATISARNHLEEPIPALSFDYLYDLVRDLDVGENYVKFLTTRLLTSAEGIWRKERYVQVMQAQMRLNALEASMSGEFAEDELSAGRSDRAYQWVMALLDSPVEGVDRAKVEGHQITAQRMKVSGVTLDGLLLIAPVSREAVPSVVLYIPQAPDGRCFRLFEDGLELRKEIFRNTAFLEYLISHAPSPWQAQVRKSLTVDARNFKLDSVPLRRNFYEAAYEARVAHVISSVNEQTNTTWERNWQDAWDTAIFVGDIALMFAPFYIALPVTALQVVYSIIRGVVSTVKGEREAVLYFNQAAILLMGLFLGAGGRSPKAVGLGGSTFNPKAALKKAPDSLQMRTDGVFNGVYETGRSAGLSRFYVKDAGKTYPVRYDRDYATWRLIDPRRPDAYYQAPISFEGGVWTHAKVGLLGGGRKAAKEPTPGSSVASGAPKRYTLDVAGFENSKPFKKADPHIQDALRQSVEKVTEKYIERGGGKFHGYEEKGTGRYISTFDLTGIPGGKGRGPWRLQVIERVVLDESGQVVKVPGQPGVLEFDKLLPSH
ncbi:hypothetical protein KDX30_11785 [Pseudomonas sp. CDFA 553]|uniref:dermonecrotic toxin domain-containing protein n=1 Tax=Pseudomonas quasicaspiana TaxID=2829821 RepID=UPI001E577E77|nr:DUF6543 domain-containing protein [Pseudomonas quasicaspiana]MCD5988583.1 hypothetical protein [Pseudomonas quasicaspiana]